MQERRPGAMAQLADGIANFLAPVHGKSGPVIGGRSYVGEAHDGRRGLLSARRVVDFVIKDDVE
jgi:hypothetical protein